MMQAALPRLSIDERGLGGTARLHQQAATVKRGVEIIVSVARGAVSRPRSTRSSIGKACPSGSALRLVRQAHDASAALALLDRLDPRTILLADKAYDGNSIRDLIESQGAVPNIPAKSNRKWKPCFSKTLYRERNQVERFFSKLKHFRRIATRYDKLAENFLAMVKLASVRLWLRAYESTA